MTPPAVTTSPSPAQLRSPSNRTLEVITEPQVGPDGGAAGAGAVAEARSRAVESAGRHGRRCEQVPTRSCHEITHPERSRAVHATRSPRCDAGVSEPQRRRSRPARASAAMRSRREAPRRLLGAPRAGTPLASESDAVLPCLETPLAPTSATSRSSPTSTTARPPWSTPCCAPGRRLQRPRRDASPTGSWTPVTWSGRRASRSSPRTPRCATRPAADGSRSPSTSSTPPATPTSAARSSAA